MSHSAAGVCDRVGYAGHSSGHPKCWLKQTPQDVQNIVLWLRDLESSGGPRKPAREDLDPGLDKLGLSFISSLL